MIKKCICQVKIEWKLWNISIMVWKFSDLSLTPIVLCSLSQSKAKPCLSHWKARPRRCLVGTLSLQQGTAGPAPLGKSSGQVRCKMKNISYQMYQAILTSLSSQLLIVWYGHCPWIKAAGPDIIQEAQRSSISGTFCCSWFIQEHRGTANPTAISRVFWYGHCPNVRTAGPETLWGKLQGRKHQNIRVWMIKSGTFGALRD